MPETARQHRPFDGALRPHGLPQTYLRWGDVARVSVTAHACGCATVIFASRRLPDFEVKNPALLKHIAANAQPLPMRNHDASRTRARGGGSELSHDVAQGQSLRRAQAGALRVAAFIALVYVACALLALVHHLTCTT